MESLTPIQALIAKFNSRADFADKVGVSLDVVHKWYISGRIPSRHQSAAVRAAIKEGITEVDANWMLAAHAREAVQ